MWAKTFAQSQKVYQVVYLKTANPILIIVKNWSFVKPQKDLARAHAQLWVKNLWILKLSSFWPQIASEVGSDVPDPGAVPLKWGCWTTLFFIRRRIHQNIKQRQKLRIHIERWNWRLKIFEDLRALIRQDKRNIALCSNLHRINTLKNGAKHLFFLKIKMLPW